MADTGGGGPNGTNLSNLTSLYRPVGTVLEFNLTGCISTYMDRTGSPVPRTRGTVGWSFPGYVSGCRERRGTHTGGAARAHNQSVSCWVKAGNSVCTSAHVFWPSTMLVMAAQIVSSSDRTCFMLSRSRRVNVWSLTDWKSTVMPSGVPSSSFRE